MDYRAHYHRLINKAQRRQLNGYVERHHIIPRAHGGKDETENIVELTAREHYIAHRLLYKIYESPAMARAFTLMARVENKMTSKDYAKAKELYAKAMIGENNVAKRLDVRTKISQVLKNRHPYTGKKRPDHARYMREVFPYRGEAHHMFGNGHKQLGVDNPSARAVIGEKEGGVRIWGTLTDAARQLGVSKQAISQAIRKQQKSKGWELRHYHDN